MAIFHHSISHHTSELLPRHSIRSTHSLTLLSFFSTLFLQMPIDVPLIYTRELSQRLIIIFETQRANEITTYTNVFVELQLNSVIRPTPDEMSAIHHFIDLAIHIPTGAENIHFSIRELGDPTGNLIYCFPFVFFRPGLRHYYPCYVSHNLSLDAF